MLFVAILSFDDFVSSYFYVFFRKHSIIKFFFLRIWTVIIINSYWLIYNYLHAFWTRRKIAEILSLAGPFAIIRGTAWQLSWSLYSFPRPIFYIWKDSINSKQPRVSFLLLGWWLSARCISLTIMLKFNISLNAYLMFNIIYNYFFLRLKFTLLLCNSALLYQEATLDRS